MSLLRPSKSLKLLSALALLHLSTPAAAQIAAFFPEYLKDCINNCQPLWSANYACTLSGQQSQDCLCQSPFVEQFYEGSTCTCTSDYEAQEFRNWFDGTNGCSLYVEARIRSSETSRPTPTTSVASSSSDVSTTTSESGSAGTTTRSTTTSAGSTTTTSAPSSPVPTTITTNGSTFITMVTPTGTQSPSIATTQPQDSSGFITAQNKKWVIPTITIGGIVVLGAVAFGILYFCFGCCRRDGRGKYGRANNPGGMGGAAAAGLVKKNKNKNKMWLSTIPFFGTKSKSSQRSDSSQDMTLVGDHDSMVDTAYYGAGAFPPYGAAYVPYQHGAPLPPIDEVQSIAESTLTRDRGFSGPMPPPFGGGAMPEEDEGFNFGYETQEVTPYTPVGNGGLDRRDSVMLPPAPVAQANMPLLGGGVPSGAGLIGAAITTSPTTSRNRDSGTFSNRYEDLAGRRMERRMFDPSGMPMPMPIGAGTMNIPRKGVPSSPITTAGGVLPGPDFRSQTVSPPVSTVSTASNYSSGFSGGGGPLAGRGTSGGRGDGGAFSGFPRAPAPAGSGFFAPRGPGTDYYEDYR
ncbi:hypothetical protein TWF694_000801 [Orbilia ellipsospora]|uniref:Extracellular membrane protein CFEM domain-containing protein n=1 Tax=Orbilia ellipsospora TaxID=2528407 RepID=A0AAV9XPN2_9PEZI